MSSILITGGLNGLGNEIARKLTDDGHTVHIYDVANYCDQDVRRPSGSLSAIKELDVLINNAGINEIDWLENFSEEQWDRVMDVNAKGIFMMTKRFLPHLIRSKGTVLNITSNAAWMPMTCSLAYNASKGAAHIMTLQMARELTKKHGITVFGVAPNRLLGTGMSAAIDKQVVATRGWTQEFAQDYQRKALLTGEETPPERVAEFIAYLLRSKENHRFLTGCILPYGA